MINWETRLYGTVFLLNIHHIKIKNIYDNIGSIIIKSIIMY